MNSGIISINNNLFETLLAISNDDQSKGLMYLDPPTPVMSFIYARPQINKFWMANTKAALDILFCQEGRINQICFGEPYSTSMIGSNHLSDLVIELPLGTSHSFGIKIGNKVELLKPNQKELKKIIASECYKIL